MRNALRFTALAACVLLLPGASTAQNFTAVIDGAQEVPPSGSPGTGLGCFSLGAASPTLSYEISFSGLLGTETAAHIHGPAPAGANAPVIFPLPLGSPKIGTVGPLTVIQLAELAAGQWYVNIHSDLFPGGEIRGQILPGDCPPKLEQHTWQDAVHFEFWMTNVGVGTPAIDALRFLKPQWVSDDSSRVPVIFKSTSICNRDSLWTPVPSAWDRVNWNPTDELFRQEAFWFFPPVPTHGMAPEMDVVFSVPDSLGDAFAAWYEVEFECYSQCTLVDTGTFRFHCEPLSPTGAPQVGKAEFRVGNILEQNRPNPFNPQTTIRYTLDRATRVRLTIYNIQGAEVRTLTDEFQDVGSYDVLWDGRDGTGNRVAAGAYFYEIQAGNAREARKMIHLR